MAAPNLRNPSQLIGKTALAQNVTTSLTSILSNSASSNKVFKINSIFAANVNGASNTDVTISIYNGTVDTYLAYTVFVPADATQIISTKETYFYLEEGCSIRASATNANFIHVIISYEEIF